MDKEEIIEEINEEEIAEHLSTISVSLFSKTWLGSSNKPDCWYETI